MSRPVSPGPKFTSTMPLPQQLVEDSVDKVGQISFSGGTMPASFPSLVSGSFPSAQLSAPSSSPSATFLGQGQVGIPPAVRPLQPQPSFIADSFGAQTLSEAQFKGAARSASPASRRQAPGTSPSMQPISMAVAPPTQPALHQVGPPMAPPTHPGSFALSHDAPLSTKPIVVTQLGASLPTADDNFAPAMALAPPTQTILRSVGPPVAPPTDPGPFTPTMVLAPPTQSTLPPPTDLGPIVSTIVIAPPTKTTLQPVGPPVTTQIDFGSMPAFVPGSMAPRTTTLRVPPVSAFGEPHTLAQGSLSEKMGTRSLEAFNDPFYSAEFSYSPDPRLMSTSRHSEMSMQVPPTLGYSHRPAAVELNSYHDDHFTNTMQFDVQKTGDASTVGIGARCCMCCASIANFFAGCSGCLTRKSDNDGVDQGDSDVMFFVCGVFGILMIVLIPVWDGFSLLNDPVWMYMNGGTLPHVLIFCAAAIPVLFLVTLTLLLKCGHRGSGARTEQTMFGAGLLFILLLGTVLVVLSEPLAQQAIWGKTEFAVNCETGLMTRPLYLEYQALRKLRNSSACAAKTSVEECNGFETTSQSQMLQQLEQSLQCTGFCYHPKRCNGEDARTKNCYPQALFTNLKLMGSCSAMAARNMESFVDDMSKQLMFEGFFLIAASIIQGFLGLYSQMGKTNLRKGRGYGTIKAPVEVASEFVTYNGDMRRRQKI